MATVKNLSYGSTGKDVKDLQKALGFTGKDVDGIFGKKTQQAVRDYQKKNGLTVDGIAGKNTLGKLYNNTNVTEPTQRLKLGSTAASNTVTTPSGFTYEPFTYEKFTYDPYKNSDLVNQAFDAIDEQKNNTPGEWVDPYKDKYMGYANQYENRDPFSYDFNSDALYQQYKDQYIQQGQLAMMDAMGQAAAMSGGYGNSYAQTVGQQVYNQQLSQLNNIMPELYQMAYDRYNQEGQELLNMYDLYRGLSDQSYSQYQDAWDRYYNDLNYATDYAFKLYGKEYGEWADKTQLDFDTWSANTNMDYNVWSTETGMNFDDYQAMINRKFNEEENQKDRDFQASENAKDRASAARAAATTANTWNVSPASVDDIIAKCSKYNKQGNNRDMEAYLDGLVESKTISQDYADYLYELYKTESDEEPENTTVEESENTTAKVPGWISDSLALTGGTGTKYVLPW